MLRETTFLSAVLTGGKALRFNEQSIVHGEKKTLS